jgi:Fe-S-cluster containining protein
MSSLEKGIPCKRHNCIQCCLETEMNLTEDDILRIRKAGFKISNFLDRRKGLDYLKNIDGKCFFLGVNGCNIYQIRPEGCRIYPLIFDVKKGVTILDALCPYNMEFIVEREDIEKLKNILHLP